MSAINVNLRRCTCIKNVKDAPCVGSCPSLPTSIPCRVPPSVTFEVVINRGGCAGFEHCEGGDHDPACSMRPVRVSCSISGTTWEESEVWLMDDFEYPAHFHYLLNTCRKRWALVKQVLLNPGLLTTGWPGSVAMYAQRDLVFAALADMARAEEAAYGAQARIAEVVGTRVERFHARTAEMRPSASWLSAYVMYLIEQVRVLP